MRFFPVVNKIPALSQGENWKELATEDPDKVWPGYQGDFGTPTGESEGFWVLDVDSKNNGLGNWKSLTELKGDPQTFKVRTPSGGLHLYFNWPTQGVRQTQGLIPGVDTRATGGYVVAPGSIGYVPLDETTPISDAPGWLLDLVRPKAQVSPTERVTLGVTERGELNKRSLKFIAQGAQGGMWHQELVQAAFDCKQQGFDEEECIELLTKATGQLDEHHDLFQIRDIYQNREVKYAPNVTEAPPEEAVVAPILIPAQSLMQDMRSYICDPGQVSGLPTGIPGLDEMLGGGVRPGEVIGVLAPAKTGKSTFTHKLIHEWVKHEARIAYASREMRLAEEVMPNLLSIELKKNIYKNHKLIDEAIEKSKGWSLFFAPGYGYFSLEDLERFYEEAQASGVTVIVLDHFHHFLPSEEYSEVQKFAKKIKTLTIKNKITTVLCIQPKTLKLDQTKITNADIRGGAVIGQALDAVIVLERMKDESGKSGNVSKVTLDIHRHKLASPGSIYLQYDKDTMDMVEVEPEPEPEPEKPKISDDVPVADRGRGSQYSFDKRVQ